MNKCGWNLPAVRLPQREPHHPRCLVIDVQPIVFEGPQHFVWIWNSVRYTEYHRCGGFSVRRVCPSKRAWERFWMEFEALGCWQIRAPIPLGAIVDDALAWTVSVARGERSISVRPVEEGSANNDTQIISLLGAMHRLAAWRPARANGLVPRTSLTWDSGPSTLFPHQESR